MLKFASLLCFLLLIASQTASYPSPGPHIADVNILLPPRMTNPVEYLLQGSDGCFEWSWDHHDILSVIPEYNSSSKCSTSARLRSIAPYSGRKETAVYAADVNTGIVVRCKVFIDNFSRIQIFHSSVKLDLDGLATLRVRAFDSQDNVFSSLVGLQFMWQLMPESEELPNHLVHVPLNDSPLSDCGGLCGDLDIQIRLEEIGVFSDLCVVKGVEIGHEIVSVRLVEPQFNQIADKIILTVAEAMSLEPPSPVFVLIGAIVHYRLKIIRGNYPQMVSLPSPHHRWSTSTTSVAKVDPVMGSTSALSLGVTNVIVEDIRVAGHIQVSSLNVVLPDSLILCMLPLSSFGDPLEGIQTIPSTTRWHLVSGRQYLVRMKVFTEGLDPQEIYITDGDDTKLYDNQTDYWKLFPVSDEIAHQHGWWNSRILKTASQGLGKLTASLSYSVGYHERKEALKVVQEIMVCDQVNFSLEKSSGESSSIFLPWAPGVYQEVELKALGGCAKTSSDYKWFSSDMEIVSISASGVVQAKKPGKAAIKVISILDSFNYDEILIEVSIPSSIVMLNYFPVEAVVGSHLQAAVTMKASNSAHFYRCDAFSSSIRWESGSESFVVVNTTGEMPDFSILQNAELLTSLHGPPCSWTHLYASRSGRAMLHVAFFKEYDHFDHSFHAPLVLKASSPIAAYQPLAVHQAGDGNQYGGYWFDLGQAEADDKVHKLEKLYLVPGTSLDVFLLGGPEQWDKGVDFIENVDVFDEEYGHIRDEVHLHKLSGGNKSLYRVSCPILDGKFKIVFKRGNLVADDHPLPTIEEISLSLTCSLPFSIALIADEPVNKHQAIQTSIQADRTPELIHVSPITVSNGHKIRTAVVGISNSGEPFANSSSLHLSWELSSCDGLAYWDNANDSEMSKYGWERFLVLQNESGMCILRATVIGFGDTLANNKFATLRWSSKNILTDAVRLQLVSSLRVSPEFNLLFLNPNAKENLTTNGGSCFLEAYVNDSRVVEVVQPSTGLQCIQLVLSPKGLGSALVTVYDIGLSPPLSASVMVQVVDVDWIKIVSEEELSIMEGISYTIDLMAGIKDGRIFDSSQLAYMNIEVHIEDHIVELEDDNGILTFSGGHVHEPRFKIKATKLGITTLYVSALQHAGSEILSQPIKIEVYAPPKVHPQDIFLVPGASYALIVQGGPTFGVYVEYASGDDEIAKIHKSSGRVSAVSPGNTTIIATVFRSGDTVVCQSYGSIKVGVPSSLTLNVQSDQLGVGREMSIYPLFPEGDLFSFYELCRNYQWTIEDEKVLGFHASVLLNAEKHEDHLLDASEKNQVTSFMSEKELGFIKILYGRSAGRTDVSVSFSCEFISSFSNSQTKFYSASISLVVVPDPPLALGIPITWVLPPHYTTSSLLPSSSELYGQQDGQNRIGTVVYSLLRISQEKHEVLEKDVISIDGDRISTTQSNHIACIQAKDRTTGRIEIAACVKVVEVAQVMITNPEVSFHMINLAVGAELSLPISYCDTLGNHFYEAHNAILFDAVTNYPDVVSINKSHNGNGEIMLKALRHGSALVRVSINSIPQKSDYMLISVGAHIHPQNAVIQKGSHLNFSIEGLSDHVSGHWVTTNASVIYVDAWSGAAEALEEGTSQVYFEGSSLKLKTTVAVLSGQIISVDAPAEMLTNAPYPKEGYVFSVKFSDTYGNKFGALGNTKGFPYDCTVDPPYVGYAKPWSDLDTGNSYCLFFPHSPEHLVHLIPKAKDMKPFLSVSVSASLRNANHVSGSATALLIGGFTILEASTLNLTPDSIKIAKSLITVLGNTDVKFVWHKRDSLIISPILIEDYGIGGRAQYKVTGIGDKKFKDKIIITLPANGQKLEIDVNYEPTSPNIWKPLLSIFAVIIITVVTIVCMLELPGKSPPTVTPSTQSTVAPVTPDHSKPAELADQSPRTPSPFIEYVRRTIDETPNYRREARRRFNPQNTL